MRSVHILILLSFLLVGRYFIRYLFVMYAITLKSESVAAVFLLDDDSAPSPIFLAFPSSIRLD